ncbi:MAG TPA: IclR family transcriptional regulator [Solirubrobacteraceae bacterium]|nr:IclR family transcriptional regulator [Solirubrobacteraceae bacterium]
MPKRPSQAHGVAIDPEHPGRYSSSLVAGLAMLRCFTAEHPIRGIADMADTLELGRSTTHRFATTLVALGFLEQGASRKYWLSPRASDVGIALCESMPVRRVARGHLRELRSRTGYTVSLAVLGGSEIVYIDRWQGSRQGQYAIDEGIGPGARRPVYCTAAGKAIAARLPAAEQRKLVTELKLQRLGPNTLTSKAALRAELERIATGDDAIVVEDEELLSGRRALAAAVLDGEGRPGAAVELAVPGAYAVEELVSSFGSQVSDVVGRVSSALQQQSGDQSHRSTTNSSGEV